MFRKKYTTTGDGEFWNELFKIEQEVLEELGATEALEISREEQRRMNEEVDDDDEEDGYY